MMMRDRDRIRNYSPQIQKNFPISSISQWDQFLHKNKILITDWPASNDVTRAWSNSRSRTEWLPVPQPKTPNRIKSSRENFSGLWLAARQWRHMNLIRFRIRIKIWVTFRNSHLIAQALLPELEVDPSLSKGQQPMFTQQIKLTVTKSTLFTHCSLGTIHCLHYKHTVH